MRQINELTHEEKIALTDDEVNNMVKYALMLLWLNVER
jgi:hypothetical protein